MIRTHPPISNLHASLLSSQVPTYRDPRNWGRRGVRRAADEAGGLKCLRFRGSVPVSLTPLRLSFGVASHTVLLAQPFTKATWELFFAVWGAFTLERLWAISFTAVSSYHFVLFFIKLNRIFKVGPLYFLDSLSLGCFFPLWPRIKHPEFISELLSLFGVSVCIVLGKPFVNLWGGACL
jgi:hypothetical protein